MSSDPFADILRLTEARSVFSSGLAAGGVWAFRFRSRGKLKFYAATKAALRSMTRSLARELLPRGIRVNAVSPGPIDTPILIKTVGKDAAEQMKAGMIAHNPMKRFGRPEEVARAVLFLAFDATYTTGLELPIDGGATQL